MGIFLFAHIGSVLLISGSLSIWHPSLYLDENGEIDRDMNRNKPLFLSEKRYRSLQKLYLQHEIPREVARSRSQATTQLTRSMWY